MKALRAVLLAAAAAAGPNLVWFDRSTLVVENAGERPLAGVAVLACGRERFLGTLGAGSSRFVLLPACGEDTLEVRGPSSCSTYVEGSMHHVRARLGPTAAECTHDGTPWITREFLASLSP